MRKKSLPMFLAVFFGSAAFIGGFGLTLSSGWLITMASTHPPIMTLGVAVVLVRFFAIFRSIARYLERILSHSAVFSRLTSLRVNLFAALDKRGIAASREINSGTFVKALVDDVERGQEYQLRVVLPGVSAMISVGAGVGLGALIQPETLWITTPSSIFLLFVIPQVISAFCKSKSASIEGFENYYSSNISASTVGVVEAMMYGFHSARKEETAKTEELLRKTETLLFRNVFFAQILTISIFGAATVGMMALTYQLTGKDLLPAVQITMVAFLPLVIFEAITAWYPNLYSAGKLIVAQENIDSQISKPKALIIPSVAVDTQVLTLELDQMQVDWGVPLADPLSMTLSSGQSVVIAGKSGSGKSTLAMGISGLLEYRGSCRINGVEIRDISNLPELLTGALQQSHIFATTLRENLKIAKSDAPDEELKDVLTLVGLQGISLDEMIGGMSRPLSGGEAKRLAVARALLSSAPIIILDEPTEHLDAELALRIEKSILNACRDRILIVITHSGWLNVAQKVTLTRE